MTDFRTLENNVSVHRFQENFHVSKVTFTNVLCEESLHNVKV